MIKHSLTNFGLGGEGGLLVGGVAWAGEFHRFMDSGWAPPLLCNGGTYSSAPPPGSSWVGLSCNKFSLKFSNDTDVASNPTCTIHFVISSIRLSPSIHVTPPVFTFLGRGGGDKISCKPFTTTRVSNAMPHKCVATLWRNVCLCLFTQTWRHKESLLSAHCYQHNLPNNKNPQVAPHIGTHLPDCTMS